MTRKAWITSDPFDLEAVARRLQAGDVTVAREGDEYYLTSPDIDAAADDQEANDIGAKIIGRINALGRMGDPNFRLVKLSRYTNEAGQNVVVGRMGPTLATVRTHATATVTQPDGTAADSPPSPWPTYLDLANTNEHVARVQEIIGREERSAGSSCTKYTRSSAVTSSRKSCTKRTGPQRNETGLSQRQPTATT
ncbi:MAG TPA: hypothetical protein VHT50_29510 [Mycobacterium sp.]|jgi:hypothetical protein|nr:hypothetical protein [Mycobacterium sp.]